jgi:hypothetical protein
MKNLLIVLFLLGTSALSQNNIPSDYFSNPLDIPLILSGSFGELRSNHFHSGLDIKTQQREGMPVYAPADGYVKRVKLAHYGYGKAMYIQHPNGYSTVYAHLKDYAGAIDKYVKKKQYEKETYEIELFPLRTELKVAKGDIIGYTGNTGSSGGPHLHYEIRDSSSRPMNPLLFGIEVPDTKNPIVNSIFAYPMGSSAHVNTSEKRVKLRLRRQKDGSLKSENVSAYGKIGFGISSDDQQNGASNKNGVYQIKTTFNGEEKFDIRFEKFSFGETRYLNRYIDYKYFKENKQRIQKLFREKNNPLSIIHSEIENGYVTIEENFTSLYTIEIFDYKGNKTIVHIPIMGVKNVIPKTKLNNNSEDYVYANEVTSIRKGKFNVYLPSNSLYEDTSLDIQVRGDTLLLHRDIVPIHKNITISVDASNYSTKDKNKLFLGRLNFKGDPIFNLTYRKGDKLQARTRTFGTYMLILDTTSPKIKASNFKTDSWISKNKTLQVKVVDDLSGISSYKATLNGKFILMEYNFKKDVLTYDFSDEITDVTENNFKLIVKDNVGNSATFEANFFRKKT